MSKHDFLPESLMMTYGYQPKLSEGAIKSPIFQTSTFAFETAEEGKAFFQSANGKAESNLPPDGLIYSRLNNPNLQIVEERMCLWDGAEEAAVFESGMAAISTMLLEFLKPGDVLLHSSQLYGGSDYFIKKVLARYHIGHVEVDPQLTKDQILALLEEKKAVEKVKFIYLETPANPTNQLVDINKFKELAESLGQRNKPVLIGVDNTYMGPIWQKPLQHGADLVVYSATKYLGGHSDIVAGVCLGKSAHVKLIKKLRGNFGSMAGPHTAWLLMRSLETVKLRMEKQALNAREVATFLNNHPKVKQVYYLGNLTAADAADYRIYKKQCSDAGAMLAFDVDGNESKAFKFLNSMQLIKLAVSLGSTESLAQHPATMTHSNVEEADRLRMGISESMIRLSIGVENAKDIIWDLEQALSKI